MYVSRGALKLESVVTRLGVDFAGKIVLDVGASTGGFTEYALNQGAVKVFAVDAGTKQLDPSLRADPRVQSYEKTDIRNVRLETRGLSLDSKLQTQDSVLLSEVPDIILIDVSFISLRQILPHIATLCGPGTEILAMIKPQFEIHGQNDLLNRGIIKNNTIRRQILKDFEVWATQNGYSIVAKADSAVPGSKGNLERFYVLVPH